MNNKTTNTLLNAGVFKITLPDPQGLLTSSDEVWNKLGPDYEMGVTLYISDNKLTSENFYRVEEYHVDIIFKIDADEYHTFWQAQIRVDQRSLKASLALLKELAKENRLDPGGFLDWLKDENWIKYVRTDKVGTIYTKKDEVVLFDSEEEAEVKLRNSNDQKRYDQVIAFPVCPRERLYKFSSAPTRHKGPEKIGKTFSRWSPEGTRTTKTVNGIKVVQWKEGTIGRDISEFILAEAIFPTIMSDDALIEFAEKADVRSHMSRDRLARLPLNKYEKTPKGYKYRWCFSYRL